jgi:uncharacterized membrane protein
LPSARSCCIYALTFLAGSHLPDAANGVLVIAMVMLAAIGLKPGKTPTSSAEARAASAQRWGNALFVPALIIPAVALLGALFLKYVTIGGKPAIDPAQATVISLALGVIVGLIAGMLLLRPPLAAPLREGRRLIDSVGWAAVLPQMLAALGALFAAAGVGQVVAHLVTAAIPMTSGLVVVATYTVGMALFTIIMGNAYAAFPVMTAGIGLPLIVGQFHGDPVIMSAIGMLSGFCGTLMTPMAANFNIVPAALLELPDRNAVIKVQVPTGVLLLICNTFLLYFLVFHV